MIVGIRMVVEHIIALGAGGSSTLHNLYLACYRRNEFKGPQTEAADPHDGQMIPLFHPRQQRWRDHFYWSEDGGTIRGLTPCGRTTIEALRLNNNWIVGLHPP